MRKVDRQRKDRGREILKPWIDRMRHRRERKQRRRRDSDRQRQTEKRDRKRGDSKIVARESHEERKVLPTKVLLMATSNSRLRIVKSGSL